MKEEERPKCPNCGSKTIITGLIIKGEAHYTCLSCDKPFSIRK